MAAAGYNGGQLADDDFDVDSEDIDDELLEALEGVLKGDGQKKDELRRIKKLSGSRKSSGKHLFAQEERTAVRTLLRSLSTAQREALVGSSSESEAERPAKA